MRLLIVTLLVPILAQAETWRCADGLFTDRAEVAEARIGCQRFVGSQSCGSGGNKFITPIRNGLGVEACVRTGGEARSPFVGDPTQKRPLLRREKPLQSAPISSKPHDQSIDPFRKLFENSPAGPAISRALDSLLAAE